MKRIIGINLILGIVGLFVAALPSPALADEFNKETLFTFSGPVELPGITLPAGTYMFTLADPSGDPSVVRVFDRTGMTCYGTFLTIPETRTAAPNDPTVRFEERPARVPDAIAAWFYPGDRTGREFLYPSGTAPKAERGEHGSH